MSKKRDHQKFVGGFALSGLLRSGRACMLPLRNSVSWSLGHSSRSSFHRRSPEYQELRDLNWSARPFFLLSWQGISFWSSLSTLGTNFGEIFSIFSSSPIIVCTFPTLTSKLCTYCLYPWNSLFGQSTLVFLTSLLLPHLSSSLTDSLPSLNLLCHSKNWCSIHAKSSLKHSIRFLWHFFQVLKHNFIVYRSCKVSSGPDCIFWNSPAVTIRL